ncbi:MAG: hypothetical protein KIS92_11975 [Planctomycetota bacterium]|nr:hypothetical protein [Planctomycetota bacterium]
MLLNFLVGGMLVNLYASKGAVRHATLGQIEYMAPMAAIVWAYVVYRHVAFKRRRERDGITDHDPDAHAPPIFWLLGMAGSLATGAALSLFRVAS